MRQITLTPLALCTGLLSTLLLSSCAITTGPDVATAKDSGLPLLITTFDTYRHNPEVVKVSESLSEDIMDNSANEQEAQVSANAADAQPVADVIGLQWRYVNLLDQALTGVNLTLRAFDSDFNVIQLQDDDIQPQTPTTQADNAQAPVLQLEASIDQQENTLLIASAETLKPNAFNQRVYANSESLLANTSIACLELISVEVTTKDGAINSYAGGRLLSSSQTPRCQESPNQ
jgi:hypothetical protein